MITNTLITSYKHFERMSQQDVRATLAKHLDTGPLEVMPDRNVQNDRAYVFDAYGVWHLILLEGEKP